jgi:hypothetical protein
MAKVQMDDVVSRNYCGPDRRSRSFLGQARRLLIIIVRSKWLAMFAIAFAVSWSFHEVDERGQHQLERQQRVTICVIKAVAIQQQATPDNRVIIGPILQACEKHGGK